MSEGSRQPDPSRVPPRARLVRVPTTSWAAGSSLRRAGLGSEHRRPRPRDRLLHSHHVCPRAASRRSAHGELSDPETLAKVPALSGEARQWESIQETGPPTRSLVLEGMYRGRPPARSGPCWPSRCGPSLQAGHAAPTLCTCRGTGFLPLKTPILKGSVLEAGGWARRTPEGCPGRVPACMSLLCAGGHEGHRRGLQRQHGFHRVDPPWETAEYLAAFR